MDLDRSRWPVFLVGCQRSGTTLVRYLLDAHPHLACPPESKFLLGVQPFLAYPQVLKGFASLGCSMDEVLREFGRLADSILSRYASECHKVRWVDKTPNYYRMLPRIDAMFGKECLYLFITRHPLDTIDSLVRSGMAAANQEDPDLTRVVHEHGTGPDAWARHWVDVNQRLTTFAADHRARSLIFRYEDLIDAPETTMSSVLAFIGETLPADLFEAAFTMSHTDGYGDWKIRETTGVHRNSVGKWTSWPRNEIADLWQLVGPTAEALGYACPELVD